MNKLTTKERGQILAMMVEGMSIRAIARLTGASKNTIAKLLEDAGNAFTDWQDAKLRDLPCKRIQCDEIWSFVKAKQKNATKEQIDSGEAGDIWTWTALCANTKLIASWAVGARDAAMAHEFMTDLAGRLSNRVQLTTDGLRLYIEAVEDAFGGGIDYAMLIKQYGGEPGWDAARRYSPAVCTGAIMKNITGKPDEKHITTSHNERQNLSMRMGMRRFTRLTNGFSKKAENHAHAVAIYFMHYNFGRIHQTLRVTPAMEAGIMKSPMSFEEMVAIIDAHKPPKTTRGPYKKKDP